MRLLRLGCAALTAAAALPAGGCATAAPLLPAIPLVAAPPPALAGSFGSRLLNAHNAERAAVGTPPLVWDEGLAAAASAYAEELTRLNRLQHSSKGARRGVRENLWMGRRGAFSPEQMIGTWAAEKARFRPGIFPAVSSTGRWSDVAHYSQIIWRDTQRVGCGLASSPQFDFLVCRYSPAGNIDGRPVL